MSGVPVQVAAPSFSLPVGRTISAAAARMRALETVVERVFDRNSDVAEASPRAQHPCVTFSPMLIAG
jgi:hypothetical protein